MIRFFRRRIAQRLRARAKLAQSRGEWREALADYQKAAEIIGFSSVIHFQLGNIHSELGAFDEAEAHFAAASEDRSFGVRAGVGLAGLAERRGDWMTAIARWERVLKLMAEEEGQDRSTSWPLSPAAVLVHLAKVRLLVDDLLQAERDFAFALILNPSVRYSREAALLRSRLVERTSRWAAYRMLSRSYRLFPEDAGILQALVRAALGLGQRSEVATIIQALPASPQRNELIELARESGLHIED